MASKSRSKKVIFPRKLAMAALAFVVAPMGNNLSQQF